MLALHETLSSRIRGEYCEMPGLRLTLPQACRLWQIDAVTCEAVLHGLLEERFLARTNDGAFVMTRSGVSRAHAKATPQPGASTYRRLRRSA
jgi:hypothetical protein